MTVANSGVYFIRAENAGPIKIGYSGNIRDRMRDMQIGCPYRLAVVAVIPHGDEWATHRRFASDRLHGEWFAASSAILDFIAALPKLVVPVSRTVSNAEQRSFGGRVLDRSRAATILRMVREHTGLSAVDMAKRCGVSVSLYSAIERADAYLVTDATRTKIGTGFGVDLETIHEALDGERPIETIVAEWCQPLQKAA